MLAVQHIHPSTAYFSPTAFCNIVLSFSLSLYLSVSLFVSFPLSLIPSATPSPAPCKSPDPTKWDKLFTMLENSQMRENMLLQYADDIVKVEMGSLRGEMLR